MPLPCHLKQGPTWCPPCGQCARADELSQGYIPCCWDCLGVLLTSSVPPSTLPRMRCTTHAAAACCPCRQRSSQKRNNHRLLNFTDASQPEAGQRVWALKSMPVPAQRFMLGRARRRPHDAHGMAGGSSLIWRGTCSASFELAYVLSPFGCQRSHGGASDPSASGLERRTRPFPARLIATAHGVNCEAYHFSAPRSPGDHRCAHSTGGGSCRRRRQLLCCVLLPAVPTLLSCRLMYRGQVFSLAFCLVKLAFSHLATSCACLRMAAGRWALAAGGKPGGERQGAPCGWAAWWHCSTWLPQGS